MFYACWSVCLDMSVKPTATVWLSTIYLSFACPPDSFIYFVSVQFVILCHHFPLPFSFIHTTLFCIFFILFCFSVPISITVYLFVSPSILLASVNLSPILI